jgi:hypothetical protein
MFADDAAAAVIAHPKMLEAKWGEHGAYCMSNPRALYRQSAEAGVPRDPQGDLKSLSNHCPACTPEAWAAKVRACDVFKSMSKPPPPRPSCEECTDTKCRDVVLRSYVVPADVGRP